MDMDYYPQPRPVLYGTSGEETPPQTQTAPVRTGPPRYPPAPPLAGEAPDPFYRPPRTLTNVFECGALVLALLYAFASAYSLLQIILGTTQFASVGAGRMVLSGEIVISLIVILTLVRLGGLARISGRDYVLVLRRVSGREYVLVLGLVALHVSIGIAFGQWQSPALWVAIAVMLYLLKPSMRNSSRYKQMTAATPINFEISLQPGQSVRITDGPFADFVGIVDNIDQEKGKVRVRVSIFGRETPIEFDFPQVERMV
jgi:hypothetical protein